MPFLLMLVGVAELKQSLMLQDYRYILQLDLLQYAMGPQATYGSTDAMTNFCGSSPFMYSGFQRFQTAQ